MEPAVIAAIITGSAGVVGVIVGKLVKDRKKEQRPQEQIQQKHITAGGHVINATGGSNVIIEAPPPPTIHPDQPSISFAKGKISEKLLDYRKSLTHYKRAAVEYEQVDGPANYNRAAAFINAGVNHWKLAEYQEAIDCYFEAEAIYEAEPDKCQGFISDVYFDIALIHREKGEYGKAYKYFVEALGAHNSYKLKISEFDIDDQFAADILENMGICHLEMGYSKMALEWLYKALAIRDKELGEEHPNAVATYVALASTYRKQGEYGEAFKWCGKALAAYRKKGDLEHPDVGVLYLTLANLYYDTGEYATALEWYSRDLAGSEKVYGKNHPAVAVCYNNMATVYFKQQDYDKMLEFYTKAYRIWLSANGSDYPPAKTALHNIEVAYTLYKRKKPFDQWVEELMKYYELVEKAKEYPHSRFNKQIAHSRRQLR